MDNKEIYIFGHQNPDTDSICSSICYAELKKKLGYKKAKAYRLGCLNRETEFVLNYFKVEEPPFLSDVKIKLTDLDLYSTITVSKNDPVKKVWDVLKHQKGSRIIPIVDEAEELEGIVSIGDITSLFMEMSDENIFSKYDLLFKNLVEVLEGTVVSGEYKYDKVEGNLYIGTTVPDESKLCDKDIVLTGKPEAAFRFANATKCGCVIITNGQQSYGLTSPSCAVVSVPFTMFKTIASVTQAVSVSSVMRKSGVITFSSDNYVDEIIEEMKTASHRNFPVVDRDGKIYGIISRRHLIEYNSKNVILIDHNERNQSVEGLEKARILEVIDHHRVADIQTDAPLFIRSEPVGCTGTIIYRLYMEAGVKITKKTAGLLLAAILSDTLMFSSPTCTSIDRNAAEQLAEISQIDIEKFGREMFTASTSLNGYTPEDIISIDRKRFSFDKYLAYISQINTLDVRSIADKKDDIIKAMEHFYSINNCDLVVLMVTDIVMGGTEILAVGSAKQLLQKAFHMKPGESSIFLPGVVSRKKQIVPAITQASHGSFL